MSRLLFALVALALAGCPQRPVARPPEVAKPAAPPVAVGPDAGGALGVEPPQPTLRLPKNFVPTGYVARLDIDPAKTTFDGSIAISGVIDQTSSVIWLHGRHLTVHRASATKETTEVAVKVTPKGEDLLEVRPERPLEAGEWTLMIDYTGEIDAVSTAGAFKQVVAGDAYVYTQLEAIYARRVFPCVDEPDNKVPWKLTLDVPEKLVAVSNTPVASEAPIAGGKRRVEFVQTKPLPSYLVAFGVGPFEIVDGGKTKGGTPVRIIALAKRGPDAAWAAKTTARILEITEDWFGIPYPYEKLDMLTIPVTVGFGAMENPGLITFTETLMLLDPKGASKARQNRWILVGAHEIAHQWFGDLVTMAYWDDIWLNEGFANWLETKTAQTFDPATHDELEELEQRNNALNSDSLVSARQIRQPITTTNDILNAFDGITYNKGASILRMFENFVGPETFQRGVREYLKARMYGNATSADFVAAISKAAGTDVAPAFATFLDQPGAPELTMHLECKGEAAVTFDQKRYVPVGSPPPPETKPWLLPVCLAWDNGAGGRHAQCFDTAKEPRIRLGQTKCPRWVMPNAEGRGYYRVAYTAAELAALRDVAWPQLTWSERRAIFNDVVVAAGQGKAPLMIALSFVPKMLVGNDRYTVKPALGLPSDFDAWVPADLRPKYEYWLRTTFGPAAAAAGFVPKDSDSLDVEQTREGLLHTVAWTARDPKLIEQAVALADRWRDLPQATRGLVLAIAVDAKPELGDKIMRDVRTEPDRAHRNEMYMALGQVRDPARQLRALELILDPKLDIRETLTMVWDASLDENKDVVAAFFAANKAAILARLPNDTSTDPIANYAQLFVKSCRAEKRDQIIAYVRKEFTGLAGGQRVVDQAIEGLSQCIAKRAVLGPEMRGWLSGVKIAKPKKEPEKAQKSGKSAKPAKEIRGAEKAPEPAKKSGKKKK